MQTLPDDTVAAFQNPLLERAAREYAGKPEGELTVADLKGLTELTLRDVSGALDWLALGSLPLQTVTTDAMQADAVRASGTTAAVTVTD